MNGLQSVHILQSSNIHVEVNYSLNYTLNLLIVSL